MNSRSQRAQTAVAHEQRAKAAPQAMARYRKDENTELPRQEHVIECEAEREDGDVDQP